MKTKILIFSAIFSTIALSAVFAQGDVTLDSQYQAFFSNLKTSSTNTQLFRGICTYALIPNHSGSKNNIFRDDVPQGLVAQCSSFFNLSNVSGGAQPTAFQSVSTQTLGGVTPVVVDKGVNSLGQPISGTTFDLEVCLKNKRAASAKVKRTFPC